MADSQAYDIYHGLIEFAFFSLQTFASVFILDAYSFWRSIFFLRGLIVLPFAIMNCISGQFKSANLSSISLRKLFFWQLSLVIRKDCCRWVIFNSETFAINPPYFLFFYLYILCFYLPGLSVIVFMNLPELHYLLSSLAKCKFFPPDFYSLPSFWSTIYS